MLRASPPPVEPIVCGDWSDLLSHLTKFPAPQLVLDEEGEPVFSGWAFRGLQSWRFELEPTIEREAVHKSMQWAALEVLVRREFKSRAPMHLGTSAMTWDELNWLAYMQHYGVPTRLLDFTYSPFVATYFALRGLSSRRRPQNGYMRLWAVDTAALTTRFTHVAEQAGRAERRRKGIRPKVASLTEFSTERDRVSDETEGMRQLLMASLTATGARRTILNEKGCVGVGLPSEFNPRLASQQGLFLINCAEELSFRESLTRMMGEKIGWCKIFDVSRRALSEIEAHLFQMNVHEQSLFPDIAGLAGVVRQMIRLHWR